VLSKRLHKLKGSAKGPYLSPWLSMEIEKEKRKSDVRLRLERQQRRNRAEKDVRGSRSRLEEEKE